MLPSTVRSSSLCQLSVPVLFGTTISGTASIPLVVPVIPVPTFLFPALSTASTFMLYVVFGFSPVTANSPAVLFSDVFGSVRFPPDTVKL